MSIYSKFIIGLGTTKPSTRVLKPPGGNCSDLFGLNTRQKAQLNTIEKTTGVLTHLQAGDLTDKSKHQSPNITDVKGSESLKTKRISSSNVDIKPYKLEPENDNYSLKYSRGKENLLLRSGSEVEKPENAPENKTINLGNRLKNARSSPVIRRRQKYGRISVLENEAKGLPTVSFPCRIRNRNSVPGLITGVDKDKLSNIMKAIDFNGVSSEMRPAAGFKVKTPTMDVGLGSSKRHSQSYTYRNPITGEGSKDTSNCCNFVSSGIRVIQPPGGISYGLY